jgi:hypothetical protein
MGREQCLALHQTQNGLGDIDQIVKRWNDRAKTSCSSDWENYLNGNVQFLFQYAVVAPGLPSSVGAVTRAKIPNAIAYIHAEVEIDQATGKIRDLPPQHVTGNSGVISRWNQQLMFVENIKFVDEVEHFVPSRFTVRFQVEKGLKEGWGNPVGESVLHGFIKPCGAFGKRELNSPPLPISGREGRNNLPVGMIQRASQIVESVAAHECDRVYDGWVLFGVRGALAGLYVCFEDVAEGGRFADKFIKLQDVFRGPINL